MSQTGENLPALKDFTDVPRMCVNQQTTWGNFQHKHVHSNSFDGVGNETLFLWNKFITRAKKLAIRVLTSSFLQTQNIRV